jgi:HAD superfamily hydrolase (TIGR01509 family)
VIKAVIFDCFGVIATEGWLPFRYKYFGDDPVKMRAAKDAVGASGVGLISHDEFIQTAADLAGISYEQARREIEDNVSNTSLLDFIMDELGDYKIGLLSNVSGNRLKNFMNDEQIARFDAICLSSEIGVAKPNAEAYEITAQRLGVLPEECVFTDDRLDLCTAADWVGMKSLLFTTTEKFIKDFRILEQIDRGGQSD